MLRVYGIATDLFKLTLKESFSYKTIRNGFPNVSLYDKCFVFDI